MIQVVKSFQMATSCLLLLALAFAAPKETQSSYLIPTQHQLYMNSNDNIQQFSQQQPQPQPQLQLQIQQQQPPAPEAPIITPFMFNSNVQEGQRVTVSCSTSSGETPISFTWLKDGQLISAQLAQAKRISIKPDQDTSQLKIASVRLDHAGNYTCLAKNRAGTQAHSSQLVVHGEPRWLKEPQNEPVVATRGQTVVIDCPTIGWPKPRQHWFIKTHLQEEFESLAPPPYGRISLAPNGSLIIKNADKLDEANYRCKSENGIGKGLQWLTSLKVTVPAHFEHAPKQQTIIVRKHSQVQLRCDAYGDTPIGIEWFKNNRIPVSQDSEPRYSIHSNQMPAQNGLISQLLIKQTLREDNLLFECVTKNPYGRDRLPIELIVQEEPDNIQEIQVATISSRSVTLMWREPYDGRSSITGYKFQYKKIQDVVQQLANRDSGDELDLLAGGGADLQQLRSSSTSDDWQHAARIMLPVHVTNSNTSSVLNNNNIESGAGMRQITIEKLEPSSKYLLRALAINSIGESKFSYPLEFQTDEEAPQVGPVNIRAQAINSTSIQVTWDEIPRSKQSSRIQGYYIGHRVANNNSAASNFVYKPYIINDLVGHPAAAAATATSSSTSGASSEHQHAHTINARLETIIHDLRRDTVYEITVVAMNSKGAGPAADFVVCKTIEMEAPKPVKLHIRRESNESIFIEWQRDPSDQNPVDDYVLYQEKNSASQEWLQVRLPGNQTQYKAPGLKCGTRYQFYVIAHNKIGKSAPSEVIGASTSGALPVIPTKSSLIKMANSTCLMVNLNAFQDNGCRIKTFTVRYRMDKVAPISSSMGAQAIGGAGGSSGTGSTTLVNSNGMSASHQALSMAGQLGAKAIGGNVGPVGAAVASGSAAIAAGGSGLGQQNNQQQQQQQTEWITVRPKSNVKHQRGASEEDRIEYLCELSPIGEYTIHVSATNDVGRSEIDYSVLMSSDELRHSYLRDLSELMSALLANIFAYIPTVLVFLVAGLLLCVVSITVYTTFAKYYEKFEIVQNQRRASRRAKEDKKRRQKLSGGKGNNDASGKGGALSQSSKQIDWWADDYEEELDEEDVEALGGSRLEDDGDDEGSSGCSSGSRAAVMHSHHLHSAASGNQRARHNNTNHHQRQFSSSARLAAGHYLSNIANSAFDTSSIDSPCNKFGRGGGAASGSTCLSTASTDSIHGRFQCLNAKQYVKMNEYTMLPAQPAALSPASNDIYGITSGPANPLQQKQQTTAGTNSPNNSLYYSTLRRTTNMQTYLPQQINRQQQQQHQQQINRRHSQNVADIYGYYMAAAAAAAAGPPPQAVVAAQQAADEAANSIFVPPQQIIYSAPNIRRQPPPGTFI